MVPTPSVSVPTTAAGPGVRQFIEKQAERAAKGLGNGCTVRNGLEPRTVKTSLCSGAKLFLKRWVSGSARQTLF